ncbi:MAG: sodium:calcium antiporter [bacterium]
MNQKTQKAIDYLIVILAVAAAAQWVFIRLVTEPAPSLYTALMAGLCIFSAAYLLTWAAELVQFDLPRSIAIILVALLAVLPEYAVDVYFAWKAGQDPAYISYATANMTGANRLLIGLGWAAVVFVYWLKHRRSAIEIAVSHRLEIRALLAATVYSFVIPLFRRISIFDAVVFLAIFILYTRRALKEEVVEPEIESGPVALICKLKPLARRLAVAALFLLAGAAIFFAAEPFAEGLLAVGEKFGVEKFILVQWVAPLASEAPEFLVAILFAWNMKPAIGLSALVSSKVNQWTLLIGMLPVVYSLSSGHLLSLPLDGRQNEEILLTAAQSLFALVIIADLRFSLIDGVVLAVPFLAQLFFTSTAIRIEFAIGYIIASALVIAFRPAARRGICAIIPFCRRS